MTPPARKIILFLAFFLPLFLSGCLYFDYGVDKEKTDLSYRTYYYGEKDKKYDFTTVLFSVEPKPRGTYNYIDFNVSISHMYKEIRGNSNKGRYISEIHFSDFTNKDNIEIKVDSINLLHKYKNGDVIKCDKIEHDLNREPDGEYRRHYYRKIYDSKNLPNEIMEHISVEVVIDGNIEKIVHKLPITKALHYTWWDVMMGI